MDNLNGSDVEGENSMVSFNHYAYGAVGAFLYRRILGLEANAGGYKSFTVKPIVGGGLTHAKGETKTPYGMIKIEWTIKDGNFEIETEVPVSTKCSLTLPDSSAYSFSSGRHAASCRI